LICFGFRRTPVLAIPLDDVLRLEAKRLSYKLRPGDGRPLVEFLGKTSSARPEHFTIDR